MIDRINLISRQFLCATPIKDIQWNNIFEELDWNLQETLIDVTINHEKNIERPLKVGYQKVFVKYLLDQLSGKEIHDLIYDVYGRLVALKSNDDCYKHYVVESGECISLKEKTTIISEGTTGLSCWQAGIVLSEWCIANKALFAGKNVLELGSGVGHTALSLLRFCEANNFYATDCHFRVLENLVFNLKLNFTTQHLENTEFWHYRSCFEKTIYSVLGLQWGEEDKFLKKFLDVDIVLAADVVFDSSLFEALIQEICFFLQKPKSLMFLAATVRNSETLQEFLDLLGEQCVYSEERIPEQKNFFWSTESPIHLYKIYSKKGRIK